MTEKPTRRPRVLIVGAGFGGLAAAKRLAGQPVDVTIIDQRNYHLFQPLELPQWVPQVWHPRPDWLESGILLPPNGALA